MPAAKRVKKQPKFIKVGEGMKRLPANAKDYVAFVHVASLLMFTTTDLGDFSHYDMPKAMKECRVLGQKDWFSPDDMQAQLFLDRKKDYPRVDPIYKGRIGWMWTSTITSYSVCAYFVTLLVGHVYWSLRGDRGLAVACRRVSPRQASALGI